MPKFLSGDHVRVVASDSQFFGWVGVVEIYWPPGSLEGGAEFYHVRFMLNGKPPYPSADIHQVLGPLLFKAYQLAYAE